MPREFTLCPICSNDSYSVLFSHRDTIYQATSSDRYVRCSRCGCVYVNPRLDKDSLLQLYASRYDRPVDGCVDLAGPESSHNDPLIDLISARVPDRAKILDLGCGSGYLLKRLQDRGFLVWGIDPSESAVHFARRQLGLPNVYQQDIEGLCLQEQFHCVTLLNVLEHLASPLEAVKSIRPLLVDNGLLVVVVPNFNSLMRRLFGRHWELLISPHLVLYTASTLRELLSRAGFKLLEINYRIPTITYLTFSRRSACKDSQYMKKALLELKETKRPGRFFMKAAYLFASKVVKLAQPWLNQSDFLAAFAVKNPS